MDAGKLCSKVGRKPCDRASRPAGGWKANAVAVNDVPKPLSRSSSCSTIELDDDGDDEDECVEVSDEECVEVSDGASSDSFCHFSADSDLGGDDASHCARGNPLNPQAFEFLPCAPATGWTLDTERAEFEPLIISATLPAADVDEFIPRADAAEFVPMAKVHEFVPRPHASVFVPQAASSASTFSFSAGAKEFNPMLSVPSSHMQLSLPMKVALSSTTVSSFVEPSMPGSGRADTTKISVHELQRLFAKRLSTTGGSHAPAHSSAAMVA